MERERERERGGGGGEREGGDYSGFVSTHCTFKKSFRIRTDIEI